jgi:hypothetical protein
MIDYFRIEIKYNGLESYQDNCFCIKPVMMPNFLILFKNLSGVSSIYIRTRQAYTRMPFRLNNPRIF